MIRTFSKKTLFKEQEYEFFAKVMGIYAIYSENSIDFGKWI